MNSNRNAAKWAQYRTWCRETSNAARQYRRAVERIKEVSQAAMGEATACKKEGETIRSQEILARYREAVEPMKRDKWESEKMLMKQINSNMNLDDPDGYVVVDGTVYAIVGTGSVGKILMIDIKESKDIGTL